MAQLTIYLDDKSLKQIEKAAKKAKSSISSWVKAQLVEALNDSWPPGYFDNFGRLKAENLSRPAQPAFKHDNKRGTL